MLGLLQVELANLIPGIDEAPRFRVARYGAHDETLRRPEKQSSLAALARERLKALGLMETEVHERARFEEFIEEHFPRKKFAALRKELDKASRSKATTPIMLYAKIVEARQVLRSYVRFGNFVAETVGTRRPELQICEGCGLLFFAKRRDARYCSPDCGSSVRVARARKKAELYEQNRKLKGAQR
jgi:predicted RNA-binding Zn-ribbon protein involved in translation (DUF1610 family)